MYISTCCTCVFGCTSTHTSFTPGLSVLYSVRLLIHSTGTGEGVGVGLRPDAVMCTGADLACAPVFVKTTASSVCVPVMTLYRADQGGLKTEAMRFPSA